MPETFIHCKAPLASYREGGTGAKSAGPTMSPSAAYGLVCSLLGLCVGRGEHVDVEVAIGDLSATALNVHYQQRHYYASTPAADFKARATSTQQKVSVRPARIEYTAGLDVILGVRGDVVTIEGLRSALAGDLSPTHNGSLPYAGDSEMPFSHMKEVSSLPPAAWWVQVTDACEGARPLTVESQFCELSRMALFAPVSERAPPAGAWTRARTEGVR